MAAAYDVVVVGAGIGGLTVGALLSARGMSVCVLERQSQVGGCIARVEFSGHEFEPGMGIYTSFGEGELFEGIFDQLPVDVPLTSLAPRPYVVRLADGTDVKLLTGDAFFDELRKQFPECADQAIEFYRKPALENLPTISPRFQSFIDTQLRGFLHTSIDQCSSVAAAAALARACGPLYEIHGGPATLAERLAESIKLSGGTIRLNTPVLRLAYDSSGAAAGVDLLNGEQVFAKKAIVSNLTIWDTYGKLVGLNRTPPEIKKLLNSLHGSGAYVVYTIIETAAIARLPSERLLVATQPSDDESFTEFTLATNGPTATLQSAPDVNDWFTFHASEEDFEDSDQSALESFWTKLHAALPELGSDIEVIETANPRTFYENTRRKLGMILGLKIPKISSPTTSVPNLFLVGDTVTSSPDLATVTESALSLANHLHKNL
ncbi:MAG TPA: NAD(P)-binding protein [Pyrinomonadaceae bacterium]